MQSNLLPQELRCEFLENPLGVDIASPRLSWRVAGCGMVRSWRVRVASSREALLYGGADRWDSGMVLSSECAVCYGGSPLTSGECLWWTVAVCDEDGRCSCDAEPAMWEMGLLSPADWTGSWIAGAGLLRSEFFLPAPPMRARLHICGLGYHEAYCNGRRVGDHELDPAPTDYEARVVSVTHDVTSLLDVGRNALGVMLGEGLYGQSRVLARYGWPDAPYGEPRLLAELIVDGADGTRIRLGTGPGWQTAAGPVRANNMYAGTEYDATQEIPGWSRPGDFSAWQPARVVDAPGGALRSQMIPPIRVTERRLPAAPTVPAEGVFIYDMGVNMVGRVRLGPLNMPRGTRLVLRFAEELDADGFLDPASTGVFATNVVQTDVYVCRGGPDESWAAPFTYHGFRYVELRGVAEPLPPEQVVGEVLHSDVAPAGCFSSDVPALNRIHEMARRTWIGNLHGIPTDCPVRERCGWLGDVQVAGEAAICLFDMAAFFAKFTDDIVTSLHDGLPTMIAVGRRCARWTATPGWGTALVQLPWYVYRYYGDARPLERHYAHLQRWVDYLLEQSPDGIFPAGLGDWCPPGSVSPRLVPPALTSTAYHYHDLCLMEQIARVTGHEGDAPEYARRAERVKAAFASRFWDPSARSFGSQTGNVLALEFGLVPAGNDADAARALAEDIAVRRGGHFSTGIMGLRYLFRQLCLHGYGNLALDTILRSGYPGIMHLINQGATTFWETWERNPVDEWSPRSRNHPMQAGFATWFYDTLGGIVPDAPGFAAIRIAPHVPDGMGRVEVSYDSVRGRIGSRWVREGDSLRFELTTPANTRARFVCPAGWALVSAGQEALASVPAGAPGIAIPCGCVTLRACRVGP